jgi:hypothetical protein
LNDQQFYEFAEALADRVLKAKLPDDSARLTHAFRLCLARSPQPAEQKRLSDLLIQQLAKEQGNEEARQREVWKTVARVLLNLDETITRE